MRKSKIQLPPEQVVSLLNKHQSLRATARALGINHSTLVRYCQLWRIRSTTVVVWSR